MFMYKDKVSRILWIKKKLIIKKETTLLTITDFLSSRKSPPNILLLNQRSFEILEFINLESNMKREEKIGSLQ